MHRIYLVILRRTTALCRVLRFLVQVTVLVDQSPGMDSSDPEQIGPSLAGARIGSTGPGMFRESYRI